MKNLTILDRLKIAGQAFVASFNNAADDRFDKFIRVKQTEALSDEEFDRSVEEIHKDTEASIRQMVADTVQAFLEKGYADKSIKVENVKIDVNREHGIFNDILVELNCKSHTSWPRFGCHATGNGPDGRRRFGIYGEPSKLRNLRYEGYEGRIHPEVVGQATTEKEALQKALEHTIASKVYTREDHIAAAEKQQRIGNDQPLVQALGKPSA